MKEIFLYDNPRYLTVALTKENVLNNLFKLKIEGIKISKESIVGKYKYIYTDYEHPICYSQYTEKPLILIDSSYFEKNKDIIYGFMIDFIKKYNGKLVISSADLINKDVILEISKNPNITSVVLGSATSKYMLTKKDYDILNNGIIKKIDTEGVDEDLEDNFDGIIIYNMIKELIGGYNYSQLLNSNFMYVMNPIENRRIKYFNLAKEGMKIYFNYEDYENIINTIIEIERNNGNRNFTYIINIQDKNKFNEVVFSKNNIPSNVKIRCDDNYYFVDKYLEYEKILYEMVSPAMDLSPFEKFLYAYSIVKHYKKYQEGSGNIFDSRNLYDILSNDYMVCVAYVNMLKDLLSKLGIASIYYSVDVDIGFDKVGPQEEKIGDNVMSTKGGHARLIVNLVDEKYGINGIYESDPTWDNILDNDSYAYSLMTFKEASMGKRYLFDDREETGIFSVTNLEKFYEFINKYIDSIAKTEKNRKNAEAVARQKVVKKIVKLISNLDIDFYNYLTSKYNQLDECSIVITNDLLANFMYDVGNYIISKVNNSINVDSYINALRVIYKNFYGISDEEVETLIKETIQYNKQRVEKSFPTTYKIYPDGTKEVYSEGVNKFDVDKLVDNNKRI